MKIIEKFCLTFWEICPEDISTTVFLHGILQLDSPYPVINPSKTKLLNSGPSAQFVTLYSQKNESEVT